MLFIMLGHLLKLYGTSAEGRCDTWSYSLFKVVTFDVCLQLPIRQQYNINAYEIIYQLHYKQLLFKLYNSLSFCLTSP